jgi:nitroimidazol reductase NimA-like FMN-containing flavoprotein (pyridoxamine 5'-phosphate oxidase superfamily)
MAPTRADLDRHGLKILDDATCDALLSRTSIGRLAFFHAGEPSVVPVTYRWVGRRVVFRTAGGEKLDAAIMEAPVAFEIDEWDPNWHTGWSVLVRGMARHVLDPDQLAAYEALGLVPWADRVERDQWVEILAEEVTGRAIEHHPS